ALARSWSASSDPRRVLRRRLRRRHSGCAGFARAPVIYAALALFLVSFTLLHYGFYHRGLILDTHEYHRYGLAMVAGDVPYRDFRVEYPPGALPTFALPAIGRPGFVRFNNDFQILMGLCAAAALLLMGYALQALRAPPTRLAAALGFFALAPLLLGSVLIYRYDLWPAALAVGGLGAILAGRRRVGFATLGLGIAAKVFPGLLVPPARAYVWRSRRPREALACLACAGAALAAVAVPSLGL